MNRQPYRTPPRWWSPRLSAASVRLSRAMRRRHGYWEHGLLSTEVRGTDHVRRILQQDVGLLIAPNHPSHADPYALLDAADQLGSSFFFMTAWQVFAMTHGVGRHMLRLHGCFSINREGHDVRAVRQAIRILQQPAKPLVIFPEGEVFHLNDRVMPFRQGAITVAALAARRSNRPVACVPCALRFRYVDDPLPELRRTMERLEQFAECPSESNVSLVKRIERFADAMLQLKEAEYLSGPRRGHLQIRIWNLVAAILGRLEHRYQVSNPRRTVPERVKQLRYRVINYLESLPDASAGAQRAARDLDDLFFAVQLYSYPVDYLDGNPSVERLAETIDKLEEDVFRVRRAKLRGIRRGVVTFGEPLFVTPQQTRKRNLKLLTRTLQRRVQRLLDNDHSEPMNHLPSRVTSNAVNHLQTAHC